MKKRMFVQLVAVALGLLTYTFSVGGSEVRAVNSVQAVDISVGGETSRGYACSILISNEVLCWGNAPIVGIVPGINTAVGIASGVGHTCALLRSKEVKCWGSNGGGQLGDGTTNNSTSPVSVVGIGGSGTLSDIEFIAASAKRDFTCAISGTGRAMCWGRNSHGAIGNPAVSPGTSTSTPVYVVEQSSSNPLTDLVTMAVGTYATCAVKNSGATFCWGDNGLGQLGNNSTGSTNAAVPVMGVGGTGYLTDATQVALGDAMGCARRSSGAVACWGMNYLGTGSSGGSSTPVAVSGVTNAVQVATAEENACVLLATGDVKCWGNWHGNSGGSASQQVFSASTSPSGSSLLTNARRLSTGGGWQQKYCAILNDDSVRCWGANNSGALGVDSSAIPYSNVPIEPQQSFTMGPVTTTTTTSTTSSTSTTTPAVSTTAPTAVSTSSTSVVVTSTVVTTSGSRSSNAASATTIAQGQSSIARIVSSTTTLVEVPIGVTTTVPVSKSLSPAPEPGSVVTGEAVMTKSGKTEKVNVTREDNKVVMSAGSQRATISILDSNGNRRPLNSEGTIELSTGSMIDVELAGFVPGESCSVWLYSTATQLGESVVSADGTVSGRFQLPDSIEAGDHRIVVSVGATPDTSTRFTLGVTYSEASKSSITARVLIAIPIVLAVCAGLLLPNQIRRRLRRMSTN